MWEQRVVGRKGPSDDGGGEPSEGTKGGGWTQSSEKVYKRVMSHEDTRRHFH